MRGKWRRVGLKWKIFAAFAAFTAGLILLLWLFQVVLLDDFYQAIKIRQIKTSAQSIARNIDNEDLGSLVLRIAQENEVCISVYDSQGQPIIVADVLRDCIIHKLSSYGVTAIYWQALQNGGEQLERYAREGFRDEGYQGDNFEGAVPESDSGMGETMVYTRLVQNAEGEQRVIMLNSTISPVGATVRTLRVQLAIVTAIVGLLGLGLALLVARLVARPIVQINRAAKGLATGDYTPRFAGGGYREIAELSDTLNVAAVELSKVERLRRELIANISHDLRTPLTLIAGYGEVMRDLPGENTPENVQVIIDEARRLTTLVNDLLDLSKLQAGTQTLALSTFDLTVAVRQMLARYAKLTEQDGYRIRYEPDGPVLVQADETRISQVIYNLVGNAIHYTGPDRTVTVRQTLRAGGVVRVEVLDTGEGIAESDLPYVWERYYKVDKTHKRAAVGTGLGLSIVKEILDLHGAHYGVQSAVGEGSNFWFELPLAAPQEENLANRL